MNIDDVLPMRLAKNYMLSIDLLNPTEKKSKHIGIYDLLLDIYDETGLCDYVAMMEGAGCGAKTCILCCTLPENMKKEPCRSVRFYSICGKGQGCANGYRRAVAFYPKAKCGSHDEHSQKQRAGVSCGDFGQDIETIQQSDCGKELILHKHMGVGITYCDVENGYKCDSLAKIAAKEAVKNDITSEQMRLLYVALSRAEERLIITGLLSEKTAEKKMASWSEKISTYQVQRTVTFLDWIMSAAMQESVSKDKSVFDVTLHSDLLLQEKDEMQNGKKSRFGLFKPGRATFNKGRNTPSALALSL